MYVLEGFERKKNGDQALAPFQRDLEMPFGERCIFLEEAQDGTNYEPVKGVKDSPTFLVDEFYQSFKLVHDFPSSTPFTTTTTHENDNWVKGFFLLVPSKDKEDTIVIHGDFMRAPPHSKSLQMHPFPIFDSSIHGGDCMTSGRELSH